jgi:hypothetical protein
MSTFTAANAKRRTNYLRKQQRLAIDRRGRPSISGIPKTIRHSQNRRDNRLVADAVDAFKTGDLRLGTELQFASLSTNAGKRVFGPLATALQTVNAATQVGLNVARNIARCGSSHKMPLVRLCTVGADGQANVDLQAFAELCHLDPLYIRSAHWKDRTTDVHGKPIVDRLLSENYTPGTERVQLESPLLKLVCDFFFHHSCIRSGARRPTRELALGYTELLIRFHAEYPRRLRKLAAEVPALMETIQKKLLQRSTLTRLQSSLLYAENQLKQPDFVEQLDEQARAKASEDTYQLALELNRLRFMRIQCLQSTDTTVESRNQKRLDEAEELIGQSPLRLEEAAEDKGDEYEYALSVLAEPPNLDEPSTCYPIAAGTFWAMVKRLSIRWTGNFKPTECPIHDNGPIHFLKLEETNKKLLAAGGDLHSIRTELIKCRKENADIVNLLQLEVKARNELAGLEKTARILRDKVRLYEIHLKQYESCRPIIQAIQANLVPGEAVVYRDFVAAYNCDGQKIQNLVYVVGVYY